LVEMDSAEIFIRDATPDDAAPLARFIIDVCARPEGHCFQSWSGESEVACEVELREALADDTPFCMALDRNRLIGALGCQVDTERHLVWLKGPLMVEPNETLAMNLWRKLAVRVPRDLAAATVFVDVRNEFGSRFWEATGLTDKKVSHVFEWKPQDLVPAPALRLHEAGPALWRSLSELHASIFPASAVKLEEVMDPDSALNCLCVLSGENRVDGFVTFGLEGGGEGRVYTLGVRDGWRRQGLGRQLLMGAMARLLTASAARVLLTVNDVDVGARRLYESVGFRLLYSGIALRGVPLF